MTPGFQHSKATLTFWRKLVRPLLAEHPTPFYLCSVVPIQQALAELEAYFKHLPVRHWLSCKTQPLRPLLQWWQKQGRPIEVVSEFEFLAAMQEGFPPEQILVNGPAKHHWLPRHGVRGLQVNLDSPAETRVLAPLAKRHGWTIGVRLNTVEEVDPEAPAFPTQFGMVAEELVAAMRWLRRARVIPQIVHCHLRTSVASASVYERALTQAAEICREARIAPRFIDCGGGFPPPHVLKRGGQPVTAEFNLRSVARAYKRTMKLFPSAQEIWLENGRWLTARSGVLVVKILDVKERRGMRHLICDGGRTMHALLSTWELHELLPVPARSGPPTLTTVTGPTCMAFDQLARRPLPRSLKPGDHLVWLDAGAYHLPWETRFSHGLASVRWHDGRRVTTARPRESFEKWWGC
jgi:diaminopimelate decarboxylase